MQDGLRVSVGADTQDLERGLQRAGQAVNSFGQQTAKLTRPLGSANGVTFAFSQTLREIPAFAFNAQTGILALSNNIPILIDNLQEASRAGGGFRAVLGALGRAVFSFGGIATIAVGALTIFGDKLFGSGKKAKEAADEIRSLNDVLNGAEGSTLAAQAQVSALVDVYSDSTRSVNERKRALQELGQINKSYFGDLTFEKTTLEELRKRQDEYTEAIINQAIVKEASAELGKLGLELVKNRKAVRQSREAVQGANSQYDDYIKKTAEAGQRGFVLDRNITDLNQSQKASIASFDAVNSKVQEYTDLIKEATIRLGQLRDLQTGKGGGSAAKQVEREPIPGFGKIETLDSIGAEGLFQQFRELLRSQVADATLAGFKDALALAGKVKPVKTVIPSQEVQNQIVEFSLIRDRVQGIASDFETLLGPAVETVFGALANGANVFEALRQSLRAMVAQLLIAIAKSAILAAIFSAIPGAGAALGAAGSTAKGTGNFLGILGQIFGLNRGAVPSFNGGGLTGGVNLTGQVVFVQRGSDLVGVLSRTNNRINRVG